MDGWGSAWVLMIVDRAARVLKWGVSFHVLGFVLGSEAAYKSVACVDVEGEENREKTKGRKLVDVW